MLKVTGKKVDNFLCASFGRGTSETVCIHSVSPLSVCVLSVEPGAWLPVLCVYVTDQGSGPRGCSGTQGHVRFLDRTDDCFLLSFEVMIDKR